MRFVSSIDKDLLHEVFQNFNKIITIEDGCLNGGLDLQYSNLCLTIIIHEVIRLGIPDTFIHHGTQKELYKECNFDVNGLINLCTS